MWNRFLHKLSLLPPLDLADQLLGVGGLDDMVLETGVAGASDILVAAVAGEGHQAEAGHGWPVAEGGGDVEAVHAGEADIAEDDVGAARRTSAIPDGPSCITVTS